jgi:hypothetical protein
MVTPRVVLPLEKIINLHVFIECTQMFAGEKAIIVLKDKKPIKSMTDIQLDLLLSNMWTSTIIKLPKSNVQIKWNKKVRAKTNWH